MSLKFLNNGSCRAKFEQELERLQSVGVIEPVQFSDWAVPIVLLLKRDGAVRICEHYQVTVNQAERTGLCRDTQRRKDLHNTRLGTSVATDFTRRESRKLVAINTQKGLFRYKRLPL